MKSPKYLVPLFSIISLMTFPEISKAQERLNENFCSQDRSTCNALLYTSQEIDLTYNYGKGEKEKDTIINERLSELGWKDPNFTDVKSISLGMNKKGVQVNISDAQVFSSKTVIDGKTYYLFSFRGTQEFEDVVSDLSTTQTKFKGSNVHSGFLDYAQTIYADGKISQLVNEIKLRRDDNYEILITGHSLGGAAAMTFSALLQEDKVSKDKIKNIVFGAPSPGDRAFTQRYLDKAIRANIDLDAVPRSTTVPMVLSIINSFRFPFYRPDIYDHEFGREIKISVDPAKTKKLIDSLTKKISNGACLNLLKFSDCLSSIGETIDYYKSAHLDYQERVLNIYQQERGQRIAKINNLENINRTSCLTFFNASHIGSSSCFFSGISEADAFFNQQLAENSARIPNLQQSNQYTDGQIVNAPLDIGLTWNPNTKLDLDSHLITPNNEQIYFSNRGNLNQAPNAFLYRDSIPDPNVSSSGLRGAEQTRITQFQSGQYRFYIYNYSDSQGTPSALAAGPNGLSNSGAIVKLYEGGKPLTNIPNDPNLFDLSNPDVQRVGNPYPGNSTFNVPTNQAGNTWYVFKLDTKTGILYRVDRFGNSPNSIGVPKVR
jgi:Lipase (class 3)